MKARKLELKELELTDEVFNSQTRTYETIKQGTFSYREILKQILLSPGPQGSNTTDEVVKSVLLYGKLKETVKTSSKYLLLDKEDYDYLLARLNGFKWAIAHTAIGDFIHEIRNLAEVELEEKKPEAAAPSA